MKKWYKLTNKLFCRDNSDKIACSAIRANQVEIILLIIATYTCIIKFIYEVN